MTELHLTEEQACGWESLAADHAFLPTQDLPWALASLDAFGGKPAPFIQGPMGAPDAIAAVARRAGRLTLLGAEMYEPCDLLCRSDEARADLAAALVADGAVVVLGRIPRDSETVVLLQKAVGGRGIVRVAAGTAHPRIELGEEWLEVGGGLSSSRRSALRRSRRKAEQVGPISVELLEPSVAEVPALLDLAFAIEERSWKGDGGTALAQDPPRAAFIRRYAEEMAARGALRLEFLKLADEAVAMQIGFQWKQQLWLLKIGYDKARSSASPGQLLLAESVAAAARRGLSAYQLLGEAAEWTRPWTGEEHDTVAVRVYPASGRAAVALIGDARTVLRRDARRRLEDARQSAGEKVASRYVAGRTLEDARRDEARYAAAGYLTTVGFWDRAETPLKEAAEQCFAAAAVLPAGGELSIKLPALGGDGPLLDELLDRCADRGVALHLDALGPEAAEATLTTALRLVERAPGAVGCTLTGRWRRSIEDAERVAGSGLKVRVVKGEWADPADPTRDAVAGYLEVVGRLLGQVATVEIATHDRRLSAVALDRLVASGTACEIQVLHGMNGRRTVLDARRKGVPVRVYVPYGHGRVPYATDQLLRRPSIAAKAAFDVLPVRPWLSRKMVLVAGR